MELRRKLVEAGDRPPDALSGAEAKEARREQAVLVTELERRGEPLEEPRVASGQDRYDEILRVVAARPALRAPDVGPGRPGERATPSSDRSAPGPGIPF